MGLIVVGEADSGSAEVASLRESAAAMFRAGVEAADPRRAILDNLRSTPHGRPTLAGRALDEGAVLRVVAFGKAAVAMAMAVGEALPAASFQGPGIVSVNRENFAEPDRFRVFAAGHPVPDAIGVSAARAVEGYVAGSRHSDALLVLISGGGSALLPAPAPGIGLADKAETTRLLLACGAPIHQVNCVRKHLSTLKGGGLARLAAPARVEALILSDVVGDDLSCIASGPTAPDPTTFEQAHEALAEFDLLDEVPVAVRRRLERGMAGEIDETPTARDAIFERVENRVVGSNGQSLEAARRWAVQQGFQVHVASAGLIGEAREAASSLLAAAHRLWPGRGRMAILAGGETTVTIRGQGVGGRNQELTLAFALDCERHPLAGTWVFVSGGTDGRDGPTEAAGGRIDAGTLDRIRQQGLDPRVQLERNDSHTALAAAGDLLVTGPTGTNVADLQILLISDESRRGRV